MELLPPFEIDPKVTALIAALPEYLKNFLGTLPVDKMADELRSRGNLSEEVIARVENEVLFAVLGVIPPEQMEQALRKAGVPEEILQEVLTIATEEVFGPLALLGDEAMESQVPTSTQSPTAAPLSKTLPSLSPPARSIPAAPKYEAPLTSPVADSAAVTLPAERIPKSEASKQPSVSMPTMRTMAMDVEGVQHPTHPASQSITPAVPVAEKAVRPVNEAANAIAQDLRKFGIDPYREPLE
jgi:hypothetical protein